MAKGFLRSLSGRESRAASRLAVRFSGERHSGLVPRGDCLWEEDSNSHVFAVFSGEVGRATRPAPYIPVRAGKDTSVPEEVVSAQDPPYWIRGRR